MKAIVIILKIAGGLLATVIVLLTGLFIALNSSSVQNRLLGYATTQLQEFLQTEVHLDSVSIHLFGEDVSLHGLKVKDRQHRDMLELETLGVELNLWKLVNRQINITEAKVSGLTARLYKPASDSDSVANYQFVIDAFKKKDTEEKKLEQEKAKKEKLTFQADQVLLERIRLIYNDQESSLGSLLYKKNRHGDQLVDLREVTYDWQHTNKKGITINNRIRLAKMEYTEEEGHRFIDIDSAFYATDNHLPRKNVGKPKRGAFDAGHFDIMTRLRLELLHADKDSIVAVLNEGSAVDRGAGLNITDLRFRVHTDLKRARLSGITIRMPNTSLTIDSACVLLPSKKTGQQLSYRTSPIRGRVMLKDIAHPFAPVLGRFNIPVSLQAVMSGDDDNIHFRQVQVSADQQRLLVHAAGDISGLKDKHKLRVQFKVSRMSTTGAEAEHIINQFAIKKFMMKQLRALGRITYNGHFEVLYKREQFTGRLGTVAGPIDFFFALDERNKYVFGSTRTDSFMLGRVMDMPDIGKIACKANFRFDISKPRTARMRRQLGGKLPIGHIDAEVSEAKYKKVKVRNVVATIHSNGAIAEGDLAVKGKRVDVLCSFSFTNTSEMRKTKIKPGVHFHKLNDEQAAEKAARKEAKAQAKAERKAVLAAEKAAKAKEKAAKAEEKAAAKAARKARKDSLKAARKAAR